MPLLQGEAEAEVWRPTLLRIQRKETVVGVKTKLEVKMAALTKTTCSRKGCSKRVTVAALAGEPDAPMCSRRCFEGSPHVACKGCGEPVSEPRLRSGAKFCTVACQARAAKEKSKLRDVPLDDEDREPTELELAEA